MIWNLTGEESNKNVPQRRIRPSHVQTDFLLLPGGGEGQLNNLQLPHELHWPNSGKGAELRLSDLHALLPARLHPAGFHTQPQIPGAAVSGGKPGDDGQLGPHLLLLNHSEHRTLLSVFMRAVMSVCLSANEKIPDVTRQIGRGIYVQIERVVLCWFEYRRLIPSGKTLNPRCVNVS